MNTNTNNGPFYVVTRQDVSPNAGQDDRRVEVRTAPARTNLSNEPRIDGWCGTTNDVSVYARGEYATLDEAREAIARQFGAVRADVADADVALAVTKLIPALAAWDAATYAAAAAAQYAGRVAALFPIAFEPSDSGAYAADAEREWQSDRLRQYLRAGGRP